MPIARLAAYLALGLVLSGPTVFAATPPAQPKSGPGGAENPGAEIVKRVVGTQSAYTYAYYAAGQPEQPRPVVVFLHGWGATNPMIYGGWIDHLARRGYLVLFPAFQEIGRTRPVDATPRAVARVKAALAALGSDPQARPDRSSVAVIGHSAGAGVASRAPWLGSRPHLPRSARTRKHARTGPVSPSSATRPVQGSRPISPRSRRRTSCPCPS